MNKKRPVHDEYNWDVYTQEYSAQAEEAARSGHQGSDALVKHSHATPDGIVYKDNLHGNWKGIYSAIHRLKPASVFECGCGGMHHLYNIKTLMPGVEVYGCDLLQSQLDWGKGFWNIPPHIVKNVKAMDFSKAAATEGMPQYDFVYSQAVVMHLSHEKALRFVKNMAMITKKHLYLVEGPQHDYVELMEMAGELENFEMDKPTWNSLQFTRV